MEQNKAQQLQVQADFEVPVERLFEAWTNPEQLKQWWKTTGYQLTTVTNELKQGGKVQYRFENDELDINGEYEKVEPNASLVYTWNWKFSKQEASNGNYRLNIQFSSNGNGSQIKISQESLNSDEHLHPHEEGWKKGLEDLKHFLKAGNSENATSGQPEDSSGGYNEDPEQTKVGGES